MRDVLIEFLDRIMDYENENNGSVGTDERESYEFVDIFLSENHNGKQKLNIMNIRDEINTIIATNCYTEEDKSEDSVIMGEDFGKLADDLVKFCNLHFVSTLASKC